MIMSIRLAVLAPLVGVCVLSSCADHTTPALAPRASQSATSAPASAANLTARPNAPIAANYASLPEVVKQTTDTAALASMCTRERAVYDIGAAPASSDDQIVSAKLPTGGQAIATSLASVASGRLTTATTIEAYPVEITLAPGTSGYNAAIGGSVAARPMWVIEYTNVVYPLGTAPILPSRGASATPSSRAPIYASGVMDFVDVQSGLITLTMACS